jgi:hypothetical protein
MDLSSAFDFSPRYKPTINRTINLSPRFDEKNKKLNKTRYVRADRMKRKVAVDKSDETLKIG